MAEFTDYQRKMWRCLTYLTVARYQIDRERGGKFVIRKSSRFRLFLYYFMWLNTGTKVTYMALTYHGLLGVEAHFLDQMAMWDWFLCFSQFAQEAPMWHGKYPFYEILHANWTVQEDIFRKLGSPRHVVKKINGSDRALVYLHVIIVLVGCLALPIQFFSDPKYVANLYAIVPCDNPVLRAIFFVHEVCYVYHIWVHQAASIVLLEVFAVSYTNILREMTQVVYNLIKVDKESTIRNSMNSRQETPSSRRLGVELHENYTSMLEMEMSTTDLRAQNSEEERKYRKVFLNPDTVVPGTDYTILSLLGDYQKVTIATNAFNSWMGKWMAGTMASNYGQFISDVFIAIQLLKEPETDAMGVFFFFEDACAGMVMLFRMLILISRMSPASEGFLQAFRVYVTHESPMRKYLLKYQRYLRKVATKIGGYSTRPITVPTGINALMNYYIGAAMWQRPKNRRT